MDILSVLNLDLEIVKVIDDYYSLLWAERYNETGDFEMELPVSYESDPSMTVNYFITSSESERVMIIGNIRLIKDEEAGDKIFVKGYSAESLTKSRVTKLRVSYVDADLRTTVKALVDDHCITTDASRVIPDFSLDAAMDTDSDLSGLFITGSYDPQEIYEIIKEICISADLGFKVWFDSTNRAFKFRLYSGIDRSYSQSTNPYVVFSDDYDNVVSSEFFISGMDHKTVCLLDFGEDNEGSNLFSWIAASEPTGFERKEVVTQTDLETKPPGVILTYEAYNTLIERRIVAIFDGELDIVGPFAYEQDFYIGDVVQCIFSGRTTQGRVVELVRSINEAGTNAYASFDFDI